MKDYITKQAQYLLQYYPEKYEAGTTDYGYYHNGVGMACYGKEIVYDTKKAFEDAKERMLHELDFWAGKNKDLPEGFLEDILAVPQVNQYIRNLIEKE